MSLVILDCDGTLVDGQAQIVEAMHRTWSQFSLPSPGADRLRSVIGLSLEHAMADLEPDLAPRTHAQMAQAYREQFTRLRSEDDTPEALYPGVHAALDALTAAGHLLGVATGKSQRGLRRVLEHHDLLRYFAVLKTADDAPSKPHPQMLLDAIAALDGRVGEAVMVGDTTFDMEMAVRANVAPLGVDWGYHDAEDLRTAGARAVLHRFDQLPGAVEEILA